MIYSNGTVIKSQNDKEYDSLYKLSMESYLLSLKNYNDSLVEIVECDTRSIGCTALNETFNIKEFFSNIGKAIKTFFSKIIEVCKAVKLMIENKFYTSDQLIVKHIDEFKTKVEKYGKTISYDILIPNPSKDVFGTNGSKYSNSVVAQIDKVFIDFVNSNGSNNTILDKDIESSMNEIRGKICDKDSLTAADFKSELENSLLIKKSGTGLTQDIVTHIIKTMNQSPEALHNAWVKTSQNQMKDMLKTVDKISKVNENNVDEKSFAKMKAYINGSMNIINVIHTSYMNANVKIIQDARKLFLQVMRTIKTPTGDKTEESEA